MYSTPQAKYIVGIIFIRLVRIYRHIRYLPLPHLTRTMAVTGRRVAFFLSLVFYLSIFTSSRAATGKLCTDPRAEYARGMLRRSLATISASLSVVSYPYCACPFYRQTVQLYTRAWVQPNASLFCTVLSYSSYSHSPVGRVWGVGHAHK